MNATHKSPNSKGWVGGGVNQLMFCVANKFFATFLMFLIFMFE